ncbi:tyrosine--tRNA ligase [Alphaproteobacteria bacterium]|nr:tyrosine--tRNA ligase [Alphaproteobacteria bacterium]
MKYKITSDFLKLMFRRGDHHDSTNLNAIDELAKQNKLVGYIGFDATAPSLHVGNLMQVLKLKTMQNTGQKPIVLIGGGTTKIGDPSGKDSMRKIQSQSDIEKNIEKIKNILSKFITFGDGKSEALLVNNSDWLDELNYIEFLKIVGPHFTINRMLTFDSVKNRLDREQPLSFLEFNYMILQAYDFLQLNRNFGCNLQMGGSDQWGNIINGIELCRRMDEKEVYGLTSELLTTSSGNKMGKTADGAVWLSEEMLSPYNYWNFWRNTEDKDVIRFLRLFTYLPEKEIIELEKLEGSQINQAKIILANEATSMCHGKEQSLQAEETSKQTFLSGTYGDSLTTVEIPKNKIAKGLPIFLILKKAFNLSSGAEARRLLRSGGAKLNDKVITEETLLVNISDADENGIIKLSIGKKRHNLIKIV